MKRFLAGVVVVSLVTVSIVIASAAPAGPPGSAQYYDTLDPASQFGFFQGMFFTVSGIPASSQEALSRCLRQHNDLTLLKLFQLGTLYIHAHPEYGQLNAPSVLAKGLTETMCP
jgi:hypothetical protein